MEYMQPPSEFTSNTKTVMAVYLQFFLSIVRFIINYSDFELVFLTGVFFSLDACLDESNAIPGCQCPA